MPGSVQNAEPLTVLPHSLSRAFVREREYIVLANKYRNSRTTQRGRPLRAATPRDSAAIGGTFLAWAERTSPSN